MNQNIIFNKIGFTCDNLSLMSLFDNDNFFSIILFLFYVIILVRYADNKATADPEGDVLNFSNSGVVPIKRTDVGWNAFVTVRNVGPTPVHVFGRLLECCEEIGDDENDCNSIRMMGGSAGILEPTRYKNMTFLYPNMYPYNRKGECSVEIWYKDVLNRTGSVKVTIPFNTYVSNGIIPSSMAGFGDFEKLQTVCSSPDRDPLDNCQPVDCHKKYSGNKNFFSSVRNLCVPNPTCYSDPDKELPDVAYVPSCNECRDVEAPITEDDLRTLIKPPPHAGPECTTTPLGSKEYTNVRCHHGYFDNDSTLCECHAGWASAPIPEDIYISSTLLLHFCTVRKPPSKVFNFEPILEAINSIVTDNPLFVILAAAITSFIIVLFVCCCINGREYKYAWGSDYSDEESSEENCESDESLDLDDEIEGGTTQRDGGRTLEMYFAQDDYLHKAPEKSCSEVTPSTKNISTIKSADSVPKVYRKPSFQEDQMNKKYPICSTSTEYVSIERSSKYLKYYALRPKSRRREPAVYCENFNTRRIDAGFDEPSIPSASLEYDSKKRVFDSRKEPLKHHLKAFIEFILDEDSRVILDFINKKYVRIKHISAINDLLRRNLAARYMPRHPKNKYCIRKVRQRLLHGTVERKTNDCERSLTCSTHKHCQDHLTIVNECIGKKRELVTNNASTKTQIYCPEKEEVTILNLGNSEARVDIVEEPVSNSGAILLYEKETNDSGLKTKEVCRSIDENNLYAPTSYQPFGNQTGEVPQPTAYKVERNMSTISENLDNLVRPSKDLNAGDLEQNVQDEWHIAGDIGVKRKTYSLSMDSVDKLNFNHNHESSSNTYSSVNVDNEEYYSNCLVYLEDKSSTLNYSNCILEHTALNNNAFAEDCKNNTGNICIDSSVQPKLQQDFIVNDFMVLETFRNKRMPAICSTSNITTPLFSVRNISFSKQLLSCPEFKMEYTKKFNSLLSVDNAISRNENHAPDCNHGGFEDQLDERKNPNNHRQPQKSLIPILKTSPRGARKLFPDDSKKNGSETTKSCSKTPERETVITCGLNPQEPTPNLHNTPSSIHSPPKKNQSPQRALDRSNSLNDILKGSGNIRINAERALLSEHSLKRNKKDVLTIRKTNHHLSKRPNYENWSQIFKIHGIEVTPQQMKQQYRKIRSFEHGILYIHNFYRAEGDTKGSIKYRKRRYRNQKEDLEAIIVFGRSRGEIKRYYQFVENFMTLYDAVNPGLDGDNYDAVFADIRPGNGVFDPRIFPDRGITRVSQKLEISIVRQILAALQHEATSLRYMLVVFGEPMALNVIERYSYLFARIRYHRELKIHKITSKMQLYDFLLKNVLYFTPSMKKTAIKKDLPLLRILWKSLLYLSPGECNEYTFARSLNFLADIFVRKLFRSSMDCCNRLQCVQTVLMNYTDHIKSKRKKVPFSIIKIMLKNLSIMKKRDLIVKLVLQRTNNLNKNLSALSNKPRVSNTLIQLKRDMDSAINRYHEAINEFDYVISESNTR